MQMTKKNGDVVHCEEDSDRCQEDLDRLVEEQISVVEFHAKKREELHTGWKIKIQHKLEGRILNRVQEQRFGYMREKQTWKL